MMPFGGNKRVRSVRRTRRIHVLIILFYTVLALVLTWPLVGHLGSHVPGDGSDDPPLTWNLWWVRHSLLEEGQNPFDCDHIFYPIGINLAFYTLTVLNGLLSIPLQGILGLVTASNLVLLSSFVLSGYGAFLLARILLSRSSRVLVTGEGPSPGSKVTAGALDVASLVAGLFYAFASNKLIYASLGQWNIASSQWIPFYILCLYRLAEDGATLRHASLAAVFLLFQAYAEMTYATFLVLFTALWLLWRIPTYRGNAGSKLSLSRRRLTQDLRNLGALAIVVLLGLLPLLLMMIPELRSEGDIFVEGGGFADVFSADLLGFLVPTQHHPFLGGLVERFSFDHQVGQHLYMGYTALALVLSTLFAGWRIRQVRFWSVSAVLFWLLSLGPTLRVNGHSTHIYLPFSIVSRLPFFNGNRYPSRYSVLLILSIAMLLAFSIAMFLGRADRRLAAARRTAGLRRAWGRNALFVLAPLTIASLIILEHLSTPLPLSDMQIPPVYDVIEETTPQESTLLDIPVAWRNGSRVTGTADKIIMFEQYYQTSHSRRLLAGNTSRNPPLKFQYFTQAPIINTLIALELGHRVDPVIIEADRSLSPDVLQFFNIAAVVVHPLVAGLDAVSYVESTMPVERIYEDQATVAFKVADRPLPQRWSVTPGDWSGALGFVEGWGAPANGLIWAQRRSSRILALLDGQAQEMAFRAFSPEAGQTLRLVVNNRFADQVNLRSGWSDYAVALPEHLVVPGLNEIQLQFDTLSPVSQLRLLPRVIGQTTVVSPVSIVVQSAGLEVGDLSRIYVDGQDVSPNERGYNIALLNPVTGAVEQTGSFDTHLDAGASAEMERFLRKLQPGYIVVVSAADEASQSLGPEASDALRLIGASRNLQGKFRWGHAIVGVLGAAPGTALEALDWMRPVTLVVGDGLTEAHAAAAFTTITFNPRPLGD